VLSLSLNEKNVKTVNITQDYEGSFAKAERSWQMRTFLQFKRNLSVKLVFRTLLEL